ncbi:MAG TPA: rhomboid family intramembrane serine protease [Pyrinomonadaceae bacterium]
MKSSGVIDGLQKAARLRWKVLSEGQLNNSNYAGRPSVCRNCGALIAASEEVCSLCGAPKIAATAPQETQARVPQSHDRETIRFARAILSRPYIFTIVFLIANIFVFILTSQSGANENAAVLIKYGAKVNSYIDTQHEWWRFITPIFLHGNIAHLLMNMYGLWVIGPYVERLYGSAKFVFFWIVTGIAGVVASYLSVQPGMHNSGAIGRFLFEDNPNVISVGASGALFGLIGVLFVFGIKFRRELPEGFKRAFGTGMLPTILLNVAIGFMIPVIDNAAHLGGLAAGALLALFVGYKRPGERAGVAVLWHILQVAALALVVWSFVMVARNFNKTYDIAGVVPSSIIGNGYDVRPYLDALNSGQTTLITALTKDDPGKVEESIQTLDKAIQGLDAAPPPDETATALRNELKSLLTRARDFLSTPAAKRTKQRTKAAKAELFVALDAWIEKRDQWVKAEGKRYGIFIPEAAPAEDAPK